MKKLIAVLCAIIVLALMAIVVLRIREHNSEEPALTTGQTTEAPVPTTTVPVQTTAEPTETTAEPTTETTEAVQLFQPQKTANSDPANWNTVWEVAIDHELVEAYTREEPIRFESGEYFSLPGVASFRGGNYRADASYGTADISRYNIEKLWSMWVGYVSDPIWNGCGWTGQPLVVQWDEETKQLMNLYEEKKNKEDLVEVVYAKMDGRIHFFDMEDGSATRDSIHLGMVFKGSGALDPRGYPLLYVGSGLEEGEKLQRIYVVSLIDGKVLYEFCARDMTTNRWWFAFDSSPLVHAETDTLIWPCENGQVLTFKLNTVYDKAAGTISVTPDPPVKSRYTNDYHKKGRYIGYEASVTAVENYLYIGDNAGSFHCIDINTMDLVWAQDLGDDINATAAFDWGEDGRGYLYAGASLDYSGNNGLPLCKIDAQTGEILWEKRFYCDFNEAHVGGVMASPMLGREGTDMEDLLIFTVADIPKTWAGTVYAVNKHTGETVWEQALTSYTWSSPVGLYTEDGKGYVFQIDNAGCCFLLDGGTGEVMATFDMNDHVEASPVAFGDRVMIGTRSGIVLFQVS